MINSRFTSLLALLSLLPLCVDASSATGVTPYRHAQLQAKRLLEPLAALIVPSSPDLPIGGVKSGLGEAADRPERFARVTLLAALLLQSKAEQEDAALRAQCAQWIRDSLAQISDPASPFYFGADSHFHQIDVEMGLLTIALQIAPTDLWDPLSPAVKDQLARWLSTARGVDVTDNNHRFMPIHILSFLNDRGYGEPSDRAAIDEHFRELEALARGHGWFKDGSNKAIDYYNSYGFHFYALTWARFYGKTNPDRADRWRTWARDFTEDFQYFFAADGSHPAFGRSLIYRFAVVNAFGLAAAEDCTDVPLGRLRRLVLRNIDYFLAKPNLRANGALGFGWVDEFRDVAEYYAGTGSAYWANKAFVMLLMPPNHPFWTTPEQPLLSEQGDFVHPIPSAGLLVRGIGGEVEILNAGSAPGFNIRHFGLWKWSKFSYRTNTGFTLALSPAQPDYSGLNWSADGALILELADGKRYGRHATTTTEMDDRHLAMVYNLGVRDNQVSTPVDTAIWWNHGWLLQVHRARPFTPGKFHLGGFVLPSAQPGIVTTLDARLATAWSPDGQGSVMQPLLGFARGAWETRLDDTSPRTAILAPYHATPVFSADTREGEATIAALVWTGRDRAAAAAWTIKRGDRGHWVLHHPSLGDWEIIHALLPALPSAP